MKRDPLNVFVLYFLIILAIGIDLPSVQFTSNLHLYISTTNSVTSVLSIHTCFLNPTNYKSLTYDF